MKNQTYPCMAKVGTAQCKNKTKTPDYRCSQHKNVKESRSAVSTAIPTVGPPLRKPVPTMPVAKNLDEYTSIKVSNLISSFRRTKDKSIFKDRYIKRDKDPKDYSGSDSAFTGLGRVFNILSEGVATGSTPLLVTGFLSSGFIGAALFASARYQMGIIDVESNKTLRELDLMLPDPVTFTRNDDGGVKVEFAELADYKEAFVSERERVNAEAEKNRVLVRGEKDRAIVKKHWRNLEEKAKVARANRIKDLDSSDPSGNLGAALLYESFREQFITIGADHDPAAAALKRAEEIESYPMDEYTQLLPYPPFIVRGISPEEREAAREIINELRDMSEALRISDGDRRVLIS